MNIDLSKLNYSFKNKPLLVGGKAKEYYEIRKSGEDIDLIVSSVDYEALVKLYPDNRKDVWGDFGVAVYEFEIWKTICQFDYDYLSESSIEMEDYRIISLEKLLFLTALAIKTQKYLDDLYLIVDKVLKLKYKDFDDSKYKSEPKIE